MSEYTGGSSTNDPNAVTLVIDGGQFTGWQEVAVTRGIEITPGHFSVTMTDPDDVTKQAMTGAPGKEFKLLIGSNTVVTGYIDHYAPFIRAGARAVRIQGRSRCQDLVDCSIDETKLPGMQISGGTLLSIAKQVAQPYNVTVLAPSAGNGLPIPQINVSLGETPYALIERIARYEAVLVHDDENGALVLDSVGSKSMASGLVEGVNVQAASIGFAMDQRYSDIAVYQVTSWTNFDIAGLPPPALSKDQGVPRYRRLVLMCEQVTQGANIAQQRADWEKSHRYGRSQAASVTVDNWRDSAGTLWTPNALVTVQIPHCRLSGVTWLIAQVSFLRGSKDGTRAELILMPQEAFQVQPNILTPFDAETYAGTQRNGGSAAYASGHDKG